MSKHNTVLIKSKTRKELKLIGRKGQTYYEIDELLRESKSKQDSLDGRLRDLQPSESGGQ